MLQMAAVGILCSSSHPCLNTMVEMVGIQQVVVVANEGMWQCVKVRKDSALRRIGSPVGRAPGRDRAAASTINPMARAFSASVGRGRNKGGLLNGHISSTEATVPGTPPKTATEALAAMQSRLASETPSSGPTPTDFSTFKGPETQVLLLIFNHCLPTSRMSTRLMTWQWS